MKFCSLNIVGFFARSQIKADLQLQRFSKITLGPAFPVLRPHYGNMSHFLGFLRVPLGSRFSDFSKVLLGSQFGAAQSSALGPLLFNIDMINLFYEYEESNVASYADDTTLFSCATDIPSVALEVQASATKLFRWFKNNHLKANSGKSHILLSTNKLEIVSVDEVSLAASSHEKLLGVTIDSALKFENHIKEFCLKVGKKINALCRMSNSTSLGKRKTLMKAFIESQFNHCPLIWMFRSRTLNNKINHIHERALRTVYSVNSSFYELLDKDGPLRFIKEMSKV